MSYNRIYCSIISFNNKFIFNYVSQRKKQKLEKDTEMWNSTNLADDEALALHLLHSKK